ncbi:MFS transporter [Streptomyces sp. NPDC006995]|uniref:MFS transporter n=1 Tax=Streptomyces sp. NPDC006995 TaxID=3156907 RepID=UPI00340132DA
MKSRAGDGDGPNSAWSPVRPVRFPARGPGSGRAAGQVPPPSREPTSIAALCIISAGQAVITPTLATLLARSAPPERMGELMGAQQSASAAARAVGPLCAGTLYGIGTTLPYLVAAAVALLAALTLAYAARTPRTLDRRPAAGDIRRSMP